ncbi:unnamed protein product, partial [Leptidea sinapis]
FPRGYESCRPAPRYGCVKGEYSIYYKRPRYGQPRPQPFQKESSPYCSHAAMIIPAKLIVLIMARVRDPVADTLERFGTQENAVLAFHHAKHSPVPTHPTIHAAIQHVINLFRNIRIILYRSV